MDHWLRNRKWWWSILLRGIGVLLTNAYIQYCQVQEEANVPRSQKLTHYQFPLDICAAWIDKNETDIKETKRIRARKWRREAEEAASSQQPVATRARLEAASSVSPSPMKAPRVNEKTLHPTKGKLRHRLDRFNRFHCPIPPTCKKAACALHQSVLGQDIGSSSQHQNNLLCCNLCHVHLCVECFQTFHTVHDLASKRLELKATFEQ